MQEILVSAGKPTDLILLDFSKAFDKVNYSKLVWKPHQYGIRGNALSWIHAFLGNQLQTDVIEGEESGGFGDLWGTQGSVLGPILFLVFINGIIMDSLVKILNILDIVNTAKTGPGSKMVDRVR